MNKNSKLISGFVACLALVACDGAAPPQGEEPTVPSVSSAPVGPPDTEWVLHGNDVGEQRFSTLDQINRDTVDQLELAWSFNLYTRRGVEATPLMVDGTLYVTGSWSMVYALDARSGELKWFHDPQVDRAFLAKGCCDAVNRGAAYADGRVFVATYDGRLVALDAGNGEVLWDVQTTDRNQSYTITGAPRVVKDRIVIGNGGAELGVRGYVSAYDQKTGEMAWRFHTVPGNPADGFESDAMAMAAKTWTGDWWKWGGGGTAWDSMVFDPELNLLYIGVGNGSPWNAKLRSPEGGDNLFLASIVALNPDTGEYVWHYQTTPGETWDYTATQHIIMAELEIDGTPRKVLMQAPKNGFFYVIDRTDGTLISAEPYVNVMTWASHVDMETGRPVETENARVFDGKNVSLPGNAGGHNWPPMSYNPELGLVYIPTLELPMVYLEPDSDLYAEPGRGMWNTGFDRAPNILPEVPDTVINAEVEELYKGQVVAWDPVAQKRVWAEPMERPTVGGTLATAGGLVFHGGKDTYMTAVDAESGDVLWSRDTQTSAWAAPMTYAIGGEQYLAIAAGFGGGLASEASAAAHGWEIPNISRVLVYKLGGTHELPAVPDYQRPLVKPDAVSANDAVVEQGKVLFHRHCAMCHGDSLRGGGVTPDLRYANEAVHSSWQEIVLGGALEKRGMISFSEFLSETDAESVRQYVLYGANRLYNDLNPGPQG
ncbi:PQQ-dependent dehydrogenase, methanol/ethanol family [Halioglobus maricola]|uniref:PQQ-dependent dehydrogenase, methanol/ethanol family n=1 Tax=Halioglobus maricola TaxID=2601894 RepID=A0A5P9NFA8_9GAMM|nr:PQQ-dependent dehydrogenase, methanol/ethanol family [Halioglobus maricola]QFU74452.1 PQQ-dependent dehydrogenase, methanol/ethanol family [Halioglobus maricola]